MNENVFKGQAYGMLSVTEQLKNRQDGYAVWKRKCKYRGEILVNSKHLKSTTVQNRGSIPKIMSYEKTIANNLGSGEENNCSFARKKARKLVRDLSNQRFGRLVALYPTEKRDEKSCIYWHCRCDCGNEVEITSDQLLYHRYKSCGCMKRENQKTIFNKLHVVDGTCVEWLEKRKHRSDNKSGFRGVHQLKNGKYRVTIGFKKQRYYLGAYTSLEEAVKVRLDAEENLHGSFLEAYYQWKKHADQDPDWAKDNGFSYERGEAPSQSGAQRSKISAG